MKRALLLLLPLAACVAPESEPVRYAPAAPRATEPARTDLEPAPIANRGLKSPRLVSPLQVNGIVPDNKNAKP